MRRITPRMLLAALVAVGATAALPANPVVSEAAAAPQPKPVPTRWEFRVDPGELRTMVVPSAGKPDQAYYYFVYEVTNNTGQDRALAPSFELVTDLGESKRSGENVPADVPRQIIRALKDPLMLTELDMLGTLPQGSENAKRGVVVWPVNDTSIDEVTIYAAGFSGESIRVERPDTGEEIILRKSLMLRHQIPGDLVVTSDDPLERTLDQWVMR